MIVSNRVINFTSVTLNYYAWSLHQFVSGGVKHPHTPDIELGVKRLNSLPSPSIESSSTFTYHDGMFPHNSSTPLTKSSKSTPTSTLKLRVHSYMKHSKYKQAFSLLYRKSRSARDAFYSLVETRISKEMASFVKNKSRPSEVTLQSLCAFDWPVFLEEIEASMPVLYSVLRRVLSMKKESQHRCVVAWNKCSWRSHKKNFF